MKQVVCPSEDLKPGGMIAAQLGPIPVVVVRSFDGSLYGLLDKCLHQGGRLSRGKLLKATTGGTTGDYREEEGRVVVKCPWHGFEYDVKTGCTTFDEGRRIRTVTVREEAGEILAEL